MWPRDDPPRETRPKVAPRPRVRRSPVRQGQLNHERWLVSYADFITLLFAVFATMYALSVVDAKKFSQIAESLREAFKTARPEDVRILVSDKKAPELSKTKGPGGAMGLGEIRAQLQQRLADAIKANQVAIEMDGRGLIISIREAGSFAVGQADLSDTARTILGEIGQSLTGIANHVRIEGHTDNVPIHTERFASNWELSTTRATTVVRFFLDTAGLQPQRMSAAGYAEYYPRGPNDTPENRSRNRRIDIVILHLETQTSEEPASRQGQAAEPPAAPAGEPAPPPAPSSH